MLRRNLTKSSWCRLKARQLHKSAQLHSNESDDKCHKVTRVRNIGIMAHIDAGKTTTTERMLFYSGLIKHMGEVHHGNTVTDYMEQERQRGITITSAAVTFDWKDHRFNLIDTPGHIDFTMEVEQTLRVMDGGIVVLDGSAGVEAQTVTVCKQADKYAIPKLIYINKMDRPDSNFDMSLNSIESKLELISLPVQYPIKDKKTGALIGIIDILTLEKLTFDSKNLGINFTRSKLKEDSDDSMLWDIGTEKRRILTDKLSNLDDELAEFIIEEESLEKVSADVLVNSLRRVTRERRGVPVLLGSSYKNIGVQPLMDGIVFYLPSPERNPQAKLYHHFKDNLSARTFKIVHDKRKGPITFCRIYTGSLKKGDKLYNIQKQQTEQVQRVHVPFADDYEEVAEVSYGNVAAVTGLKLTTTGDLMTTNASVASRAKNSMAKHHHLSEVDTFFGIDSKIPQPVFFCSIEPPSLSQQTALDVALQQLTREDSSLKVTQDVETGQTILAGMGELHIEIIKERIRTEYKIDADLGPLQIAYRETILDPIKDTFNVQHQIGTTNHNVSITLSLIPNYEHPDPLMFDKTKESASNLANIHPRTVSAIKNGVVTALSHGPKLSCPVMNVGVKLHWLEVARGTSDTIVTATVSQSVKKLLRGIGTELLEPIMQLEIVTTETHSPKIIADLARRRGEIKRIGIRGQYKIIEALAPLSELLGYATNLRITTSGNVTFSLEFSHYQIMAPTDAEKAVKRVTGF